MSLLVGWLRYVSQSSALELKLGKDKTQKKAKAGPTREEMHAVVVDMLKKVDFNTVSCPEGLYKISKLPSLW